MLSRLVSAIALFIHFKVKIWMFECLEETLELSSSTHPPGNPSVGRGTARHQQPRRMKKALGCLTEFGRCLYLGGEQSWFGFFTDKRCC